MRKEKIAKELAFHLTEFFWREEMRAQHREEWPLCPPEADPRCETLARLVLERVESDYDGLGLSGPRHRQTGELAPFNPRDPQECAEYLYDVWYSEYSERIARVREAHRAGRVLADSIEWDALEAAVCKLAVADFQETAQNGTVLDARRFNAARAEFEAAFEALFGDEAK